MQIRRLSVLFLYCLTIILTAVKGYNDGRGSDPTFRAMLRYGRSSKGSSNDKEDTPKVVPRARAFFLGPRYGKRSTNPSLTNPVIASLSGKDKRLQCTWVGLSNLYRCTSRK